VGQTSRPHSTSRPSVRPHEKKNTEGIKEKKRKEIFEWNFIIRIFSFLFFFIFGRTETTQGFTHKLTVSICFEFLSNNVRVYTRIYERD
jgi:hypothetical protein